MEQDILVSVIVPVYNVEKYLARCVNSILNQTYRNLEVILVDDGAKDNSGAICDGFAQKDSRVRVIHKENGGLSSARNAGIDIAQGAYLEFVDSDDWLEEDAVEKLLQCALRNQVELVIGGRYDVSESTGKKKQGLCPCKEEILDAEAVVGRIFHWDNCDSAACDKLFARRLFREIRFPLGVVCEDVPVMYRIVLDAGRVALLNKPIYNYFHRKGSISITTAEEITDKTFHFSRHTAQIYAYIREHHPAIEPQARFLRVRSLYHILLLLEQSEEDTRIRFAEEYCHARRELRKHTGFILKNSYFGKKEKITDLLLAANFYRAIRPLFHRGK